MDIEEINQGSTTQTDQNRDDTVDHHRKEQEVEEKKKIQELHPYTSGADETEDIGEMDQVKEKNIKQFMRAFLPIRLLLICTGRFPLKVTSTAEKAVSFNFSWFNIHGLFFVISTILVTAITLITTFNFFCIILEKEWRTGNDETTRNRKIENEIELTLLSRNFVVIIMFWSDILVFLVTSVNLVMKSKYLVNNLNFWVRSIQLMKIDVAQGLLKWNMIWVIIFLSTVVILIILSIFKVSATAVGAPTCIGLLLVRSFVPGKVLYDAKTETIPKTIIMYQILGGICFYFIAIAAKVYIFVFVYNAKLLRTAFAHWNARVYAKVLGKNFVASEETRTTFRYLFKDHVNLLELLDGNDTFFAGALETYLALEIFCVCLQMYFCLRVAKFGGNTLKNIEFAATNSGDKFFIRPNDWIAAVFLLAMTGFLLIVTVYIAAGVGEEGMCGLEVIRRKTMLSRKSDEELYFTLSMFSSYTAHKTLSLRAGGYFELNKEFVVGVMGTIISYFIIMFQFAPTMDRSVPDGDRARHGKFLMMLEGLPNHHWNCPGSPCSKGLK